MLNIEQLVIRENDLISLPKEIGNLTRLRELHIQGNRLTVLPPELGHVDLIGSKQVRGECNTRHARVISNLNYIPL